MTFATVSGFYTIPLRVLLPILTAFSDQAIKQSLKLTTLRHPDALILYTEKVCNTIRFSQKSGNPQLFYSDIDYGEEKEKLKKMVEELLEQNRSKLSETEISKINSLISEEKYLSALQTFTDLKIPYAEIPP